MWKTVQHKLVAWQMRTLHHCGSDSALRRLISKSKVVRQRSAIVIMRHNVTRSQPPLKEEWSEHAQSIICEVGTSAASHKVWSVTNEFRVLHHWMLNTALYLKEKKKIWMTILKTVSLIPYCVLNGADNRKACALFWMWIFSTILFKIWREYGNSNCIVIEL